ncbi:hypothetical protein ATJ88_0207 [Isoptericola jiangsuensis]|uniref:DUF5808 domain-containing protein n=1 Tax=Isoptericola jiangsuensis TaxID=548579 RepID=A0A2A9ETK3_9MICO|nr:DUF5808 domain-containing protein [Isoptericola jiangsuensis]PFG41565.1 hypothetical protein ATJ88_0207 [Isoptericola jiangsuensis]
MTSTGKNKSGFSKAVKVVSLALVAAAVTKELRKEPDERTWHGTVAGFVPYELRFPTIERIKERWWAPENPQIFGPRVWGVGWAVNVGRVVALGQRWIDDRQGSASD